MNQSKIPYRIYILVGVFILICLLYAVRLTGIVLTGEKTTVQNYTYNYVTVKAVRGQIYDRNGKPLVTNDYIYELVLDDQTLPAGDLERNTALLKLLHAFNSTSESHTRTQDLYPFTGTYPNLVFHTDVFSDTTMRYRLMRRMAQNEMEKEAKGLDFSWYLR